MGKVSSLVGALLITTGLASAASAALAEDQSTAVPNFSATTDGDVVVTARKREERLQNVPESVSVLSGAQIDRGNINSLKEFVALTPNLIARTTFRSNETFLTMRGIASAQGALPPVSIIVDGVQLGSNDFINQDLLDVERIEVLRGPQGALYGQGAIAGAINIVSRQPTNDFEGFVKANYGNANSYRIAGAVSGPIIADTLLFRISGYRRDTDGLIKNARGQRLTGGDQNSLRGQLSLDVDRLKVNLRGSWTKGDGGSSIQDRVNIDATGNLVGIDDVTNPGATSNIIGTEDTRFRDISGRIDYDFGPVTLTSITGWADVYQRVYGDSDFTAAPQLAQDLTYRQNVANQDIRLTSNRNGAFSWLVGGFYQRRRDKTRNLVGTEIPGSAIPNVTNNDLHKRSTSKAVYGQLSYKIAPEIEVLGALRYDHDTESNVDLISPATTRARAKFHALQPKAQLSYKITPDILIYTTYSQGFRAGGFSQTSLFDNEKTTNYEAGFKVQLAQGRLALNGSAFHIDYENQLLSYAVVTSTVSIRRTINVPKTGIDGFELELSARPSNRLTTNFNVGLTDSVIKQVAPDPAISTAGAIGKKSPLVPPFTMSGSATYRIPLRDGLDFVAYGAVQRRGGFYFDLVNTIHTDTKTFADANLSLDAGNWTIGIFGKNLTDARNADNVSISGSRLRIPNQPRSYGAEASYRF